MRKIFLFLFVVSCVNSMYSQLKVTFNAAANNQTYTVCDPAVGETAGIVA